MTSLKAPTARLKRSIYVSPDVLAVLDQESERIGVSFNWLVNFSVLKCRAILAGMPDHGALLEQTQAMKGGAS